MNQILSYYRRSIKIIKEQGVREFIHSVWRFIKNKFRKKERVKLKMKYASKLSKVRVFNQALSVWFDHRSTNINSIINDKQNIPDTSYRTPKDIPLNKFEPRTVYPWTTDICQSTKTPASPHVFIGIASVSSFNLISNFDPDRIVLVDFNNSQLIYASYIYNRVRGCETRADFLSTMFCKNKEGVERILTRLDTEDLDKQTRLDIEYMFWHLENQDGNFCGELEEVHKSLQDRKYLFNDEGQLCGVEFDKLGQDTVALGYDTIGVSLNIPRKSNYALRGDYSVARLYTDNGFLSSKDRYQNLRKVLKETPPLLINHHYDLELLANLVDEHQNYHTILWISNAFSPSWLGDEFDEITKFLLHKKLSNSYSINVYTHKDGIKLVT